MWNDVDKSWRGMWGLCGYDGDILNIVYYTVSGLPTFLSR